MFPTKLHGYGLSEELLSSIVYQVLTEKHPLKWSLKGIPDIGLYQQLHPFLKKWSVTRDLTKISIGRFYIAIDSNLKRKGMRADNVYRLIDRISKSDQPSSTLMSYGSNETVTAIRAMQAEAKHCTQKIENLASDYHELKCKFENSRKQLGSARKALRDITNEKAKLVKQCETAKKKAVKAQDLRSDYALLEDGYAELQETNTELSDVISGLQSELAAVSESGESRGDFTFQTKTGSRYSPAIRKLYYSLLSDQVPSSKIADIIKHVIKCFFPGTDIGDIQLPKRACADYMRKDELEVISNAHKATVLCEHAAKNQGFLMNTDGTTKLQKKLGGVAINDMVIAVNEVPDGTAVTAIDDVTRELEKLRKMAHDLGLPNPDSINWTLIAASTSDSASSQKRFNRLIEECRENDEAKFGPATLETVELIETFCAMHLGVNLRKAFLSGIEPSDGSDSSSNRKHHPVDTFVHEFCKIFGKHGTPEYGYGVLAFPDFLALMTDDSSVSEETCEYYQSCKDVKLHRQVGSRYFVSASNAAKVVFLREAAVEFLKYTGKDSGNKLDSELYAKLTSSTEMAMLRADALMYYHVYADLVMLSKSTDLGKSVMDMNQHYLELQAFLERIGNNTEVAMDENYRVFESEKGLYENKKLNHRHSNTTIYKKLFEATPHDSSIFYPLVASGAGKMRGKLCTYAEKQLPGGEYWEPEASVKNVLKKIKPSNDLCESILGLNDYLTTAIPNLTQAARSNLVQVKKNHTMKWLAELDEDKQFQVMDLAVKERPRIAEEHKKAKARIHQHRQQVMLKQHTKQEALKKKMQQERDELFHHHLITTAAELRDELQNIDTEDISSQSKKARKLSLLRTQIKIRRKVLNQDIRIHMSHARKQRPLCDIVKEFLAFWTLCVLKTQFHYTSKTHPS